MKYAFKAGQKVAVLYATVGAMHVTLLATFVMTLSGGRCKCRDASGKPFTIETRKVYPSMELLEADNRVAVVADTRTGDITTFPAD